MQIDTLEPPEEVLPGPQDDGDNQAAALDDMPTEEEMQAMADEEGLPVEQYGQN